MRVSIKTKEGELKKIILQGKEYQIKVSYNKRGFINKLRIFEREGVIPGTKTPRYCLVRYGFFKDMQIDFNGLPSPAKRRTLDTLVESVEAGLFDELLRM